MERRLEAIAADVAGEGDTALEPLSINTAASDRGSAGQRSP